MKEYAIVICNHNLLEEQAIQAIFFLPEWYLFKKTMQFEMDKLDDLIQDFGSLLDKPFPKPAASLDCSIYLAGPHKDG